MDKNSTIIGLYSLGLTVAGIFISIIFTNSIFIENCFKPVFVIILGCLVITIVLFIYFVMANSNHKRYAKAYSVINRGFSSCHAILNKEDVDSDFQKSILALNIFCTEIVNAFNLISNTKCSLCIKLFSVPQEGGDPSTLELTTLCRDNDANNNGDRIAVEDDTPQTLEGNSDFKNIFTRATRENDSSEHKYYFSNNLVDEKIYENTRFEGTGYPPKNSDLPVLGVIWNKILRNYLWPLQYKSTVVVPITPLSEKKLDSEKILGFLCLDSESKKSFNRSYDIDIMRGIADGIYPTIKELEKILENENKEK